MPSISVEGKEKKYTVFGLNIATLYLCLVTTNCLNTITAELYCACSCVTCWWWKEDFNGPCQRDRVSPDDVSEELLWRNVWQVDFYTRDILSPLKDWPSHYVQDERLKAIIKMVIHERTKHKVCALSPIQITQSALQLPEKHMLIAVYYCLSVTE